MDWFEPLPEMVAQPINTNNTQADEIDLSLIIGFSFKFKLNTIFPLMYELQNLHMKTLGYGYLNLKSNFISLAT